MWSLSLVIRLDSEKVRLRSGAQVKIEKLEVLLEALKGCF